MISAFKQVKDRIIAKIVSRHPWIFQRWVKQSTFVHFTDIPWTLLTRKIKESRLALVTTGGVQLKSQPPFAMLDADGDPTFREIPSAASADELIIIHNYYDHTDADRDINIIFPIERVKELNDSREIGSVNHRHFSFMGHIRNRYIPILLNETAPQVADMLKQDGVDLVILTPA